MGKKCPLIDKISFFLIIGRSYPATNGCDDDAADKTTAGCSADKSGHNCTDTDTDNGNTEIVFASNDTFFSDFLYLFKKTIHLKNLRSMDFQKTYFYIKIEKIQFLNNDYNIMI